MKKLLCILAALLLQLSSTQMIWAQQMKCPLVGEWYILSINEFYGEGSIKLKAEKKVGQNPFRAKVVSNGYIDITDVYFEGGINYNLVYEKMIDSNTFQFYTSYKDGKAMRTGKIQLKKSGTYLIVYGVDAQMKKQPIHGKKFQQQGLDFDDSQTSIIQETSSSPSSSQQDVNVQEVLSAKDAITIYKEKNIDKVREMLRAYGYNFEGLDNKQMENWSKNCKLNAANFKVASYGKGVSSVVKHKLGGEMTVQVFNKNAAMKFVNELKAMGLEGGVAAMDGSAFMFSENEGYPDIQIVCDKGMAYEEYGGFFLMIGGEY